MSPLNNNNFLALDFLATFFHLHGAIYTTFHYLSLPFTTLSGPPLHRDRALFPVGRRSGASVVVCAGSGIARATFAAFYW